MLTIIQHHITHHRNVIAWQPGNLVVKRTRLKQIEQRGKQIAGCVLAGHDEIVPLAKEWNEVKPKGSRGCGYPEAAVGPHAGHGGRYGKVRVLFLLVAPYGFRGNPLLIEVVIKQHPGSCAALSIDEDNI